MTSVKGMTWGTPEFIAIAKQAEKVGEADAVFTETVEKVCDLANDDEMSPECYLRNRAEIKYTFDLFEGDELC